MKPRMFVGSSKEGLAVANAVQANLWRAAEVTVWTQGVFKPSSVTLPAILDALDSQDFGLFVFTPDDIALIRGQSQNVVRDNVIFELGIFIGRLGLDRSFFLVLENAEMRIATDLLGVTPLRYETNRSDDNFVAAVAPACTEIESVVKRLGFGARLAKPTIGTASDDTEKKSPRAQQLELAEATNTEAVIVSPVAQPAMPKSPENATWLDALFSNDLISMRDRLSEKLAGDVDAKERASLEAWRAHAEYRLDPVAGKRALVKVEEEHRNGAEVYQIIGLAYLWNDAYQDVLDVSDRGLTVSSIDKTQILLNKSRALRALDRDDEAILSLKLATQEKEAGDIAFSTLADLYLEREDYAQARICLESGLSRLPKSHNLLLRYAQVLSDHFDKKASILQHNTLIAIKPDDSQALTLRANLYLELDLNSLAMSDYLAADRVTDGKQAWIVANIGNLYKNVGLYGQAIPYLRQAVDRDWTSPYAHERLAGALKLQDEQIARLRLCQ